MKKVQAAAVAIGLTVIVSACGFAGGDSKGEGDSKVVKIGFIGPLTGELASPGQDAFRAAQLAVAQKNASGGLLGKKIELIRGDSQGDPRQAATLARRMVDDGVQALIGPLASLEAQTAVPILCAAKIVSISGLADVINPGHSPCYFRTAPREDDAGNFGGRIVTGYFHARSVAVIDDGTAGSRSAAKALNTGLEGKAKVVFSGSVDGDREDYTPTLAKVKSLDPDVVYLATFNPVSAKLRKQGADLGIKSHWVLASGNSDPEFRKLAGKHAVPSFSFNPAHREARFAKFSSGYVGRFHEQPGNLNEYTYDGANLLFAGIERAGELDYDKLVSTLHGLKDFEGVTGPIVMDEIGSRGSELFDVLMYGAQQRWQKIKANLGAGA